MRHLPRFLLLSLLAFELRIPMAWACSCEAFDPARDFDSQDAIYTARVVKIGGFARCDSVDLEVTEAFKGVEVGDVLTRDILRGSGGGDCTLSEIPYEVGEERLFQGSEDQVISLCSEDSPVADVPDELATLRSLAAE